MICAERDMRTYTGAADGREIGRIQVRKNWFGEVYKQRVERHRKCVQVVGGYFEKL